MGPTSKLALLLLIAPLLRAAEFHTGQAARAVIGQSTFSSHDPGIQANALSVADGKLFVADTSQQVLTFDLSKMPGPMDDLDASQSACSVCGFTPIASAEQSVMPGIAAVAVWNKSLVVADPVNRRVLIWRDTAKPGAETSPDVTLGPASFASSGSGSSLASPVSVAFDGRHLFVGDSGLHRVLVWNGLPSADDATPAAVLGQNNATSASDTDPSAADSVGTPVALASDGTNLLVADSSNRRILVFSPGDIALSTNQLIHSATLQPGPFAAGTLVSLLGASLTDESAAPSSEDDGLPTKLAGVRVLVNGSAIPLSAASPSEVRAQLPYSVSTGAASVYLRVERTDGTVAITNPISMRVVPAAPGLFAFAGGEPRSGMVLHSSGPDGKGPPVTESDPAKPGEIVTVWATGLGSIENDLDSQLSAGTPFGGNQAAVAIPVSASIDGRAAEVVSALLPKGAIGIYEVRIHLPSDLRSARKTPLFISQAGIQSNTVTFASQGELQ